MDVGGLDYVLISAKVKLPTRNEPIIREFPLYTIEKGLVQSHSGVDLLKRFPINGNAREQVSISLEVRYLSNEEALKAGSSPLARGAGERGSAAACQHELREEARSLL